MSPAIHHLQIIFPELFDNSQSSPYWTFDAKVKSLDAIFYRRVLPLHPILNVEYSILCHQLREQLHSEPIDIKLLLERLTTALAFCELLEHLHDKYLIVPREVLRLRKQKARLKELITLTGLATFAFLPDQQSEDIKGNHTISFQIRDLTLRTNWYRVLLARAKRTINVMNTVVTHSASFNQFVNLLDQYTNPVLAHLGWLFHLPRLLVNICLILKHTIPINLWMSDEEKALTWITRLHAQLQRRWFEMGNDLVWTVVGVLNCFFLLNPVALTLTVAGFAFDLVNASLRAYIELKRLSELRQYYVDLYKKRPSTAIEEHLKYIDKRIYFEHLRFGIHVSSNLLILAAMAVALPVLGLNPVTILASAVFLLLLWFISYSLTQKLEHYRPKEDMELPKNLSQLSLFALPKEKSNTNDAKITSSPTTEKDGLDTENAVTPTPG